MRQFDRFTGMLAAVLASLAMACGAASGGATGHDPGLDSVPAVTQGTFAELRRRYMALPEEAGARIPLRDALVSYLAEDFSNSLRPGQYEDALKRFGAILSLVTPSDFAEGRIPTALQAPAQWLIEHGSPRGDEATVMAARLVLTGLEPGAGHRDQYRKVAEWSVAARAALPDPFARYPVEVWEAHARLTPARHVLEKLVSLYLERRAGLLALVQREGPRLALLSRFREGPSSLALVQRTALDVAAVYLAHGDIHSARSAVADMEDRGDVGDAVLRVLVEASAGNDDALLEAAEAYRDGRSNAAAGACRIGYQRSPADFRFLVCLARIYASQGNYPEATGWYADAIGAAPQERAIYDEALDALQAFIARGIYDADPHDARGMAAAAVEILQKRLHQWPSEPPSVAPERLHYVIGLLEMNAGNAIGAKDRFEASVAAQETASSQFELGRLALGVGDGQEAARRFRRALDLTAGNSVASLRERARIMENLGSAYRRLENREQEGRHLREALQLWDQLGSTNFEPAAAEGQLRRGIILDRLERRTEAVQAFREAIDTAPGRREVYATILSHLVVAKPAAPELAQEVFSRALRELTVEPEWKVYFALWAEVTATRAGSVAPEDAQEVLRSYSAGDAWYGSLARFGIGELGYPQLVQQASTVGEQTEAYFYGAAKLMQRGDAEGARALLQRVIDTNLVNFYEHAMAIELLDTHVAE